MTETPPPGKTWITLETPTFSKWAGHTTIAGMPVVSVKVGPDPESKTDRINRLLTEAATLIRSGTRPGAQVGGEDLRQGLIRVADAVEAMRSGAAA